MWCGMEIQDYNLKENDIFFFDELARIYPELKEHRNEIFTFCGYCGYLNELPNEVLDKILIENFDNNKKVIFYNSPECMQATNLLKIHESIARINGKYNDVFLFIGSINQPWEYESFCQEHNLKERINIISHHHWEALCNKEFAENKCPFITQPYEIKIKPKKFLSWNRMPRYHRIYLSAYMIKNNLLDLGYYSFEGCQDQWFEDLSKIECDDIHDWVIKEIEKIVDNVPIRLPDGVSERRPNPIDLTEQDMVYTDNSYFSIISETRFFHHTSCVPNYIDNIYSDFFETEKLFKPIAMKHPFILMSRPNFLRKLRNRGYKTFHPFINEDYDLIEDDMSRLNAICVEIKRLCSLSDEQFIEFQQNVYDIINYNYNLFFSERDYRHTPLNLN